MKIFCQGTFPSFKKYFIKWFLIWKKNIKNLKIASYSWACLYTTHSISPSFFLYAHNQAQYCKCVIIIYCGRRVFCISFCRELTSDDRRSNGVVTIYRCNFSGHYKPVTLEISAVNQTNSLALTFWNRTIHYTVFSPIDLNILTTVSQIMKSLSIYTNWIEELYFFPHLTKFCNSYLLYAYSYTGTLINSNCY